MTLRTRLLLAQAPLAAGLVLVGLVALNTLDTLGQSSQLILRDNFRSVLAAQRMKDAVERVDSAAAFRAAGRPDKADEQATANIRAFEAQLEAQERNITEPGEAEATQRLRAAWNEHTAKYEAYRRIDDGQELRRRYFDELQPALLRVKEAAERVLEINQDAMLLKSERARGTAERNRTLLLLAISSALGLGLLASVSLTRRALRPIDSLPDPVIVLSLDGQVLNVNQAAENLLRLEAGRDPLSRLPPQLREAMDKIRAHIFAGKGSYAPRGVEEAIRVEGEGGGRALLPRATPLYSEQGTVTGASIVLQDVTRLLRFDELKNDLVATVAHEFRTPLTSMRMAVHILLEGIVGPLNDKQLDLVGAARDDCERLQGIVEDLLDLSRIQAGKVEVSLTALPAKSILDAAVAAKEDAARDGGLKVEGDLIEPVLPVLVDPDRIHLVFDNLVGNAMRHSPKGSRIVVRARPDKGLVRFEVEDQGPGIPVEYQQRIFEKFFRMPGTKGEGIGLGLYISREIVAAHGGEMGVESEPGKGSRFWFTLRVPPRA